MKRNIFQIISLVMALVLVTSCQNGSVEHISAARLVILQPITVIEKKFDENFSATLDLLYPAKCHDTAFIQEQIFLERIDLKVPYKREFVIPPKLWRDFFGSNNPDSKKSLREDMFYLNDTSFEKNPDKQFLMDSQMSNISRPKAIGDYLSRNRNNALVYLISTDTLRKKYEIGGVLREVHNDFAKLNCRIVGDLKKKAKEELGSTTVILVVIPPEINDTATNRPGQDTMLVINKHKTNANIRLASKSAEKATVPGKIKAGSGKEAKCPPDSMVNKINNQCNLVINEFRNLLHYIATTNDDDLKRKYKGDADKELHRIPDVKIEGIPNSLMDFLNSGFSRNVKVFPINNECRMTIGIRISEQ